MPVTLIDALAAIQNRIDEALQDLFEERYGCSIQHDADELGARLTRLYRKALNAVCPFALNPDVNHAALGVDSVSDLYGRVRERYQGTLAFEKLRMIIDPQVRRAFVSDILDLMERVAGSWERDTRGGQVLAVFVDVRANKISWQVYVGVQLIKPPEEQPT